MKQKDLKNLVSFFYEIGTLRKILRMHQQAFLTNDPSDNISSHSFRTTVIGYFLAKELKADTDKVVKMCLLHDIEETRCGDQNWVHKRYVKIFEEEIREGQLKNLPNSEELLKLSKEYQERKTLEAKAAKDADILDEIFLLREYELQGNKEASDWLRKGKKSRGKKQKHEIKLLTNIAKKIAKELLKQNPSLWWGGLWTETRRR
jgi:putative hydrolase of HD superfamily